MKACPPVVLLMSLALVGCQREAPANAGGASVESTTPAPPPVQPATPVLTAPVGEENGSQARFLGYGDMRLGSSVAEAREAWAGELDGAPSEPQGCHYLTPKWVGSSGELAFMIEGERFVRYDVGTPREAAPGGGRTGMSSEDLVALYGPMDSLPHKYLEGGRYLSISAPGGATKLLFETDAAGRVTSWRVGVEPQVDYVEGCS